MPFLRRRGVCVGEGHCVCHARRRRVQVDFGCTRRGGGVTADDNEGRPKLGQLGFGCTCRMEPVSDILFLRGPGHAQQRDVVGGVRHVAAPHAAWAAEDAHVQPACGAQGEHVLSDGVLCKHEPSYFCLDGTRYHLPAAEAADVERDDAFVGDAVVPSKNFSQILIFEILELVFPDEDRAFFFVNALNKIRNIGLNGRHD